MTKESEARLTRKKKRAAKHAPDILLIMIILILVGFGVVMVYSASYYHAMTTANNPFFFAKKQGLIGLMGIGVMLFIGYKFNYRIFSNLKIAWTIYGASILIALSVFVIGTEKKGATRWIEIGGMSFQPSELVKVAVIIMLSAYIVNHRKEMHKFRYVFRAGLIIIIPAAIVLVENMSSAIVIAFIGFLILFVSTPKVWYYILTLVLVFSFSGYAYMLATTTTREQGELSGITGKVLKQYRLDRIRVWKDPWIDPKETGYQPIQSLYAVGSGGIFGTGLSSGVQKLGFLPEPHNDIIFAVIAEELGLVGAVMTLLAYSILVLRGLTIASQASDYFGSLVATGISGMVGIQVLINVAVNTNTIPTTGMQLPLISYGGTALLILLGTLGLLLNVSRTATINKPMA